jgi:hypothetical protein
MTYLVLTANQLTKIPVEVKQFQKLKDIRFDENKIPTINYGTFDFSVEAPVRVYLINMSLSSIEPGAFQGNHIICFLLFNNSIL